MIEPKKNIKKLFRTQPFSAGRVGKIRLDRNECTVPFPEKHFKKIWSEMDPEEIVAYPELEPFYERLSGWLKVDRDQVLVVSGSDTGIRTVYEVYVGEGDEVVMLSPTYAMYPVYCEMFGGTKKEVKYDEDFTLPVERILDAINDKTRLVAIANPNNTGTSFTEPEIVRVLEAAKGAGALVLIDEAYYHFHEGTILSHIGRFENLVIARTFSKAFGIASLRVGYMVSNKDIISDLNKVKLTHEITGVSAKFGEYLLEHLEIMEEYVSDVRQGIEYLAKGFGQMGIFTPKTCTNFIFAKLPEGVDGERIVKLLQEKKFYINGPFQDAPMKGCIRVTAGPVEQMRGFLSVFKEVYAGCRSER